MGSTIDGRGHAPQSTFSSLVLFFFMRASRYLCALIVAAFTSCRIPFFATALASSLAAADAAAVAAAGTASTPPVKRGSTLSSSSFPLKSCRPVMRPTARVHVGNHEVRAPWAHAAGRRPEVRRGPIYDACCAFAYNVPFMTAQ